ncbi:ADP-ribosyltransferase [Cellvibrio sp. UBA7661]|uniref:ADP-ribosyltransferase n=1 Tax=Cellvibrio sp. UBA7661 TaxID=1946311 RepID=UPI002F35727A
MQPLFESLSIVEKEVFSLYKGNSPFDKEQCFADHINTTLSQKSNLPSLWEDKAKLLDSLIINATESQEVMLYRATVDAYLPPIGADGTFTYLAYMSTSTEEYKVQRHFASPLRDVPAALLKINCPVGTPILDMEINASFGGHEREFLFARKSMFKVISKKIESDPAKMSEIMGMYAKNYSQLNIYDLQYIGMAYKSLQPHSLRCLGRI